MTPSTPERPTMPDDLDQAYARAHALADDGHGPSAAVRANVLAAARDIAAQAAARAEVDAAAPPALTAVAAPVSAVGRGRSLALNLSSWRVRAGAALCAALLVGVAGWRFDASRRSASELQVAAVDKSLEAQGMPPPVERRMESPVPTAISLPPPVGVPPAAADAALRPAPVAKLAARQKDVVVAQADQLARVAASPSRRAEAGERLRNSAAATPLPDTPTPPPAVITSDAPRAAFGVPAPAPRILPAPVAPQIVATSVGPRGAQRRVEGVAAPAPAQAAPGARFAQQEVTVAAAAPSVTQRVEVTGSSIRISSAATGDAASDALGAAAKAASPADGRPSLRVRPTPLHLAAHDDDIDTMNKLLADPATQVDAPDAQGRTPLLDAVMAQHVRAVRMLLGAGADPDRADQSGATPRSVARMGVNAEIAALLAAAH